MRTLALALTLVLSLSISVPARAAVDETNAHRLNALGLFFGTGSGYDLGGTATRLHGIIMLTRMLGEEDAALSFDGPCPFSDVAAGKPSAYTGYAFAQGYTTGVSTTTFRPNGALSFKHYVTFLLRALGYDDGAGDFTFAASLDKAVEIGMMTRASADCILQKQYALYRGDLVDLSVSALTTPLADGSATLAESLAKKGVFTWEEGRAQGLIGGGQEAYVHSSLRVEKLLHRARFGTLAVRANALCHHVMTQDAVAGFLLQRFVIGAVIGVGNIHHTVTDQTVHMIVRIGPEVKAVAVGHDYPIDLPIVAQQVQISIDGSAADMGILLPDALVDLLRSGVVPAAPDHVQNQLPLTGVALLLHAHSPLFCSNDS